MPLPLAPIAGFALRYGTIAAVTYMASRKIQASRTDQATEDALDKVYDGVSAHRCKDAPQANAAGRFRRVIRVGRTGPGIEIDATILGRFRVRRFRG
jgi:hypothetical protein